MTIDDMNPQQSAHPVRQPPAPGYPQLRRSRNGRLVAGVCDGIAGHLGIPVLWVRVFFAVLAAGGGTGVLVYAILWIFVPQRSGTGVSSARDRQQGFGILLLTLGAMAGLVMVWSLPGAMVGPVVVIVLGAAVVWREADESQRRRWRQDARAGIATLGGGHWSVARIIAGSVLVIAGLVMFVAATASVDEFGLIAAPATLIGVGVLTVPWWVRLARDFNLERAGRIRSQERAEIAAHLHDSVLQTLALIQKQAGSEREVRRLARGQERELRHWLYGPDGSGEPKPGTEGTFIAELSRICAVVEDSFAITVEQVAVGDGPLDDRLRAQLAATREALVNAAKHAKVTEVSVYAEVEAAKASVFVRDRGVGFDPGRISGDRHGLADSIRARMNRHGGTVSLRTVPGDGTEVRLEMPRTTP